MGGGRETLAARSSVVTAIGYPLRTRHRLSEFLREPARRCHERLGIRDHEGQPRPIAAWRLEP